MTDAVAVIGGGIVGAAIAFTLSHRGVETILFEAQPALGLGASGTNSGILHSGFDSSPGELETELILRAAQIRPAVIEALEIPVAHCGAVLAPRRDEDRATIAALADGAASNGVDVAIRARDGALLIPGESICDPVAFTLALACSADAAGARILTDARVVAIATGADGLGIELADGRSFTVAAAINAAGLFADEVARLVGDDSFAIYPRKGEFFLFEPARALEQIVLPVPTAETKGVLVFPTLDGKVVAGPTAVDGHDKSDWSVRPQALAEISAKAVAQLPALAGLVPIASYAGLRPAGRDCNYVIGRSPAHDRLINVAAIRSTGLTACLGIADYVAEILAQIGIPIGAAQPIAAAARPASAGPWWQRTARFQAR